MKHGCWRVQPKEEAEAEGEKMGRLLLSCSRCLFCCTGNRGNTVDDDAEETRSGFYDSTKATCIALQFVSLPDEFRRASVYVVDPGSEKLSMYTVLGYVCHCFTISDGLLMETPRKCLNR